VDLGEQKVPGIEQFEKLTIEAIVARRLFHES